MRSIPFIVLGFLLAAAPAAATPYVEPQDAPPVVEPVGEGWHERWQGRRHWLYDDSDLNVATPGAATDGRDSNAQANCRNVPVRVKRSDGAYAISRINRCD